MLGLLWIKISVRIFLQNSRLTFVNLFVWTTQKNIEGMSKTFATDTETFKSHFFGCLDAVTSEMVEGQTSVEFGNGSDWDEKNGTVRFLILLYA